ncbi:hypothetical protein N7492_004335 [Penicillium capsulatum]|uniref:Uncharacterized protein n=1 Tax=Penicillium capsulatum TaxID=69766 RepID=A0A9W9IBD5_9EURO|nr:hypothetical protein N7492_004335 [Penicillium capsulatum]KAJ6136547.1 hypothetical protein N7512_001707 [Penicillium capsulatum]
MFALDWSPEGVEKITHVLSNFKQMANADPGTNGRRVEAQSKLAISCPQKGEKDCDEEDDIAVTINQQNDGQPVVDGQNGDELQHKVRTLFLDDQYAGTDANQVFHEMTHLWWIGPTNWDVARGLAQEEEYGFMECADLAANGGCVRFDNPDVVWNADHYSWYAEYGYWVEKGFDSWQEKDRPVKLYITRE